MTIQVGRNDIKLGWEVAGGLLVGIIGLMFGAGMYFSTFMAKQDKMFSMVEQLVKKDSINHEWQVSRDVKMTTNTRRIDSLSAIGQPTAFYQRKRKHYYIERKVNGRLQFIEVDNPNQVN